MTLANGPCGWMVGQKRCRGINQSSIGEHDWAECYIRLFRTPCNTSQACTVFAIGGNSKGSRGGRGAHFR
jgi:hypothetical protein